MDACLQPQVSCRFITTSLGRERKLFMKSKKLKNSVKRTLELCRTLCIRVCDIDLFLFFIF